MRDPRRTCVCLSSLLLVFLGSSLARAATTTLVQTGESVTILRDEYGVPHVLAQSAQGAFYGLGWATAEDRLFQLEFTRRQMRGRLAEVFDGPMAARALLLDKRARLVGFGAHADQLASAIQDAEMQRLLTAYCKGINDYVQAHPALPQPFGSLGIATFQPWTAGDCLLAWMRVQDKFENSWEGESTATGGGGTGVFDADGSVVPCTDYPPTTCKLDLLDRLLGERPEPLKASHNWAVSGAHTTTGKAVLHSDPQLPLTAPSFWYEFHVRGGAYDCRGIGVAGCPGLLVGWNRNIAWGATKLDVDTTDVFKLKIPALPPNSYELLDDPSNPVTKTMTNVHNEVINVKNGAPVTVIYKDTEFGPVVTQYLRDSCHAIGGDEFALGSLVLKDTDAHSLIGMLGIMKASSWCETRAAMHDWRNPGIHFLYADLLGNIGYTALAVIPNRQPGTDGSLPLDGSLSTSNWRSEGVPFDLMPARFNPPEGFISTANNMALPATCSPIGIPIGSMGDTIRSWRLRELLSSKLQSGQVMRPADVLAIHNDSVNPAMRVFAELTAAMLAAGTFASGSAAESAAIQLGRWNVGLHPSDYWQCVTTLPNQVYPLIHVLEDIVVHQFRSQVPTAARLVAQFGGGQPGLCHFLKDVEPHLSTWVSDSHAIVWVTDMLAQGWAAYHPNATFDATTIAYQTNSISLCGAACTPFGCSLDPSKDQTASGLSCVLTDTIWSQLGNSYSQFVDFASLQDSKSVLPIGISELPTSPHYADQKSLWIAGALHQAPLDGSIIMQNPYTIEIVIW